MSNVFMNIDDLLDKELEDDEFREKFEEELLDIKNRNKVDKLPDYLYEDVYKFYKARLSDGMPITKIGHEYNLKEQANYAESTLRNKYEEFEKGAIVSLRESDLIKRERLADRREERYLLQNQKRLRREHMFKGQIKRIAELDLISEIFKEEKEEYVPIEGDELKLTAVRKGKSGIPLVIMGDVHAGYEYEGYYNDDVMKSRMEKAFSEIYEYIVDNNVEKINIAEMGDQIEGTGLRKAQLAYTSQMMTKQAMLYEDVFMNLLTKLAEKVPETKITVYFITKDNHSELRVHNTGPGNIDDHFAEVIGVHIKREIETANKYGGMENVSIILGQTHLITTDDDRTIFLAHGHKHSGAMDKLPEQIYGDIGMTPDIIITGHYHQFKLLTRHVRDGFMGMTVVAPSIVGDTDFSSTIHKSSHPGILIMEMGGSNANFTFKPVN